MLEIINVIIIFLNVIFWILNIMYWLYPYVKNIIGNMTNKNVHIDINDFCKILIKNNHEYINNNDNDETYKRSIRKDHSIYKLLTDTTAMVYIEIDYTLRGSYYLFKHQLYVYYENGTFKIQPYSNTPER